MALRGLRLLVISDRYPHSKDTISSSFVKGQVDCLKNYFEKIYVIALTPFVPKFAQNFWFINPRWKRDAFARDYKYDNVEVYFAKHMTLPFNCFRKSRGDVSFKVANEIIRQKRIAFDLIHANFIYPSGYVGVELKNIYNVPLVVRGGGHDIYEMPFRDLDWNNRIRYILESCDHVILPSRGLSEIIMQLNVPLSKVSIIYNGCDPKLFQKISIIDARTRLNLPKDCCILLAVGNLELEKGHQYLIESMKIVFEAKKDIICVVVGSGSLNSRLVNSIASLGLQNQIQLIGERPHAEIPLWMNACDIFVVPSLNEGNPNVMFEALSCGKPVIGTKVGGIPEIIIDEKFGILVEPRDVEGLAKAILRAFNTQWDTESILNYAEQFTLDRAAERIAEVYESALKEN